MAGIQLAEAIADLRSELAEAMKQGKNELIKFGLGPIELEFEFAVTKEGGVGGKAKFWVLEFNAEGKLEHARTHRLKLTLDPMDVTQPPGEQEVSISRRKR